MKKQTRFLAVLMTVMMVISMLGVTAQAGEYTMADTYVLNYNGIYEGPKWQYFSPYWPEFVLDGQGIIVSHDRDFLDGLVDKLYEFRDGRVKEHLGGVQEFLERRRLESLNELERHYKPQSAEKPQEVIQKKEEAKQEYQAQKYVSKEEKKIKNRISFLEKKIEEYETKMAEIEAKLMNPGPGDDIMDLTREYLENKRELDYKMEEWAELTEKIS